MQTNDLQIGVDVAAEAAGGKWRLADLLGISRSAVSQWKHIPHKRTLEVERLTGVPRTILRPDLYPDEQFEAAE